MTGTPRGINPIHTAAQPTPSLQAGGNLACWLTSLSATVQADDQRAAESNLSHSIGAKNALTYRAFSNAPSIQNKYTLLMGAAAHGSLGQRVAGNGLSLIGDRHWLNGDTVIVRRKNDCAYSENAFFIWRAFGSYAGAVIYKARTACASTHQRGRLNSRTLSKRSGFWMGTAYRALRTPACARQLLNLLLYTAFFTVHPFVYGLCTIKFVPMLTFFEWCAP